MDSRSRRCKCQDGRRAGRWVVLRPAAKPGGSARLKCLVCGWKFSRRGKWLEGLPLHKEESRSGMTDKDILSRIESGSLVVDTELAIVTSVTARYGARTLRIIERESNGSTYRFVEVTASGKKKKISLHRLVWIAAHRQLPPAGYDVDHEFGMRVENPDGIWNLRLLTIAENRATNRGGRPTLVQDEF